MSYRQLRKLKETLQSTLSCEHNTESHSSSEDNVKPKRSFFAQATCLSSSSSLVSEDDNTINCFDEKWACVFLKKENVGSCVSQHEYKKESDSDTLRKYLLSSKQKCSRETYTAKTNTIKRHEEIVKTNPYLQELLVQNLCLVNRTSAATDDIIQPNVRKSRVRTPFMKRFLLLPEAKELNWPFVISEAQRVTCVSIKCDNEQIFFNFIEAPIRTTVLSKLQINMKKNLYETCILKLLETYPFHMELNLLYCQLLIDQNNLAEAFTYCRRCVHALQCSFPSKFSPSFFYSTSEPPWPQVQVIDKSSPSLLLVYCILFMYSRFLMYLSRYFEALQVFKLLILLVPRQDMFLTFLYIDECFINLRSYKRLENFCSSYFNDIIIIDGKKQKENGLLYYPSLYFSECLLQLLTLIPSDNSSLHASNTIITPSSICTFHIQFTNLHDYTLFMMLRGFLLFPYFLHFLISVLQLDINTPPIESNCNVAWKDLLKCDIFKCFWKKTCQRSNQDGTRRFLIETTRLSVTKFKDKWKQPKILAFIHETVSCLVNLFNTKVIKNDTIQTFRRQWWSLVRVFHNNWKTFQYYSHFCYETTPRLPCFFVKKICEKIKVSDPSKIGLSDKYKPPLCWISPFSNPFLTFFMTLHPRIEMDLQDFGTNIFFDNVFLYFKSFLLNLFAFFKLI